MNTGLEDLLEKVANTPTMNMRAPHMPIPGIPGPLPTRGGIGFKGLGIGAGLLGAAGLGLAATHQSNQDAQQYHQVAPPLSGVY